MCKLQREKNKHCKNAKRKHLSYPCMHIDTKSALLSTAVKLTSASIYCDIFSKMFPEYKTTDSEV